MANKIFAAAASAFLFACSAMAQTMVVTPPKIQEQKPEQPAAVQQSAHTPRPTQPTLHTALVCIDADGKRIALTPSQWKAMPLADRQRYGKIGIEVLYGDRRFTLGLRDYPSVTLGYVGHQVPDQAQWQIIMANRQAINQAIDAFGGTPIDDGQTYPYWHKGEKDDATATKTARLCVAGDGLFAETIMQPAPGDAYERVGESVGGISPAICQERYGFIDEDGHCVVPAKYEYLSAYGAACDHGLYGMIDHDGNVIVPFIYDGMIAGRRLTVVFQEGMCGAFDNKGRLVIPIEYDEIMPSSTLPMAMAGKDGHFALVDDSDRRLTPFSYDRVVSAQDCGFAVGRDGLNLYLGVDGKEYANADDMKMAILRSSADPADQYTLAKLHYDRKNYFESMKYASAAASAGHAPAQCLMGHFYANGRGSAAKSDTKAFEWYEKAAKQGCEEACYHLAQMYEKGRGVYRNPKLAAEWYEKSNGYRP